MNMLNLCYTRELPIIPSHVVIALRSHYPDPKFDYQIWIVPGLG